LVFEQGLFGYKFMALGVMLIVLCVVRGMRIGETLTWLALVTLAWNPIPNGLAFNARSWGHSAAVALPLLVTAVILGVIIWDAIHLRVRWYLVAAISLALLAFVHWPPWSAHTRAFLPTWLLQLLFVPTGVALAAESLVSAMWWGSNRSRDVMAGAAATAADLSSVTSVRQSPGFDREPTI
jgi:hypothetical protein